MDRRSPITVRVIAAALFAALCTAAHWAYAVPSVPEAPRVEPPKAVLEFETGRPGQPKQRRAVVRLVEVREAELREEPVRFRMPKRFAPREPVVFEETIRADDPLSFNGAILVRMYEIRKGGREVITNEGGVHPEYERGRVSFRVETRALANPGEHFFKVFLSISKTEKWDLFVSKMVVEEP